MSEANTTTEQAKAKKVRVLVGVRAEIEPGHIPYYVQGDVNKLAAFYEKWADEINEFFRDHRHQDVNAIQTVHDWEEQCSACGHKWELTLIDGEKCCAWCGTALEKQ